MISLFKGLKNYWPKNVNRILVFQHTASITILAIIVLISYGTYYAPVLHSDDWSLMVGRWYFGRLNWFDLTELRPLLKLPLVFLYSVFGLNIHAFYAVLLALNLIAAILLYFLVLKLIPKNGPIALGIAAIFLVYPADITHMWLTMIMVRLVVVLTLMYAYLLLVYFDTGYGWALGGALLCLAFPFGIYEGQLGLVMTWPVLLFLLRRSSSWRKWLGLLLPLAIGMIFVWWRMFGYSKVGISDNYQYIDRLQLTPMVIITRYITGYRLLIWTWIEPVNHALSLNGLQSVAAILLGISFFGFLAYAIGRALYRFQGRYLTEKEHLGQVRSFLLMVIIGPTFIAAGYIPVITVFEPSTFFRTDSRVNLFALLGAAVTIAGLLTLAVLLVKIKWTQRQVNFVGVSVLAPLIILGMMIQTRAQYDDRVAWEEQKQIWHQLFELAPDLKEGTSVYFLLSESQDQGSLLNSKRLPFAGSWEIEAALNMLYGKQDLRGDVFVRELLHMADDFILKELLLTQGIKNRITGKITRYDSALFLAYDSNLGQLMVIEDLESEDLVNFPVPTYKPYERIIDTPTRHVELRWLVGAATNAP